MHSIRSCSLSSESLELGQTAYQVTSFEGPSPDLETHVAGDSVQLLRRSFSPGCLELPERTGSFWAAIEPSLETSETRSPEEIRSLHQSFYTEPLELSERPETSLEVTCAEWPPVTSQKVLRTIMEESSPRHISHMFGEPFRGDLQQQPGSLTQGCCEDADGGRSLDLGCQLLGCELKDAFSHIYTNIHIHLHLFLYIKTYVYVYMYMYIYIAT